MAKDEYFKSTSAKAKVNVDEKSAQEAGKNFGKSFGDVFKSSFTTIGKEIKSVFNDIVDNFKVSLKDTISEMSNMLEYSQLSSSKTRELALGYGFSSSEAYGYTQAMQAVGLESEEDLFYANAQELKQFREAFEKYSNYYTELYDSGFFETMQDYQFAMADFRKELQMEVITFFMDNKNVIKAAMEGIISVGKFLVQSLGWIINLLGGSSRVASTSDIISNYTSSNRTNNVNISNTFNNVAKNDEQWLAHSGELTYEQVIKVLTGGN